MNAIRSTLCAGAALLAAASLAYGQPAPPPAANLVGAWTLAATFELPVVEATLVTGPDAQLGGPTCSYEGTANVATQDAQGNLTGSASIDLVQGDPPCPAEMSGMLTGTLTGTTLTGKLTDPNLGESEFTGALNLPMARRPGAIAAEAQAGSMMAGSNNVTMGPFTGAVGTFTAIARASVIEIPTLGTAGLAALVLLLAASAAYLLLRRRSA